MNNIWIAMSGGVDSSGAALLIKEKYTSCAGVTLTMLGTETDAQNVRDAAQVCGRLGIGHTALDCRDDFTRRVIEYFADSYKNGQTPNPCVICNREIKFGFLLDEAVKRGFDGVATGHYARIYRDSTGHCMVRKAADVTKDQSYVLAQLTTEQLKHCIFPLGDYTKAEIRALAAEHGFVTAHKSDSQDICFVPDGDYVEFLTAFTGEAPVPGEYVDPAGKVLGAHRGQQCYTIGQRKGLGIALGRHMFVLEKDAKTNRVVLGDEPALFKSRVSCTPFHHQTASPLPDGFRCTAKLRYAHKEAPARLWHTEDGCVLEFDSPQRAPSPGQFAVCYDGDLVLGSAVIR
ncbi:MAG: tRNA 2-thiouridine(34) synthase MnmA [Clostridia bacterium]|nr:tRNA 2-thiouridine(34) synthase MnmA [Clostridia bacterium]